MKQYIIERDIPGVGALRPEELAAASEKSNAVLATLGGRVKWHFSYVVDDKTFCVYEADGVANVMEHARLSGFPASKVSEVRSVMSPQTARGAASAPA